MSKVCFKCGERKPLSEFYKHSRMKDDHLNKCKECTKKNTKENRTDNFDYYQQYDRNRPNKDERNKKRSGYVAKLKQENYEKFYEIRKKGSKNYKRRYPQKRAATVAVNNAIRDGKLYKPDKCQACGDGGKIQGHHESYDQSKWLDVVWLCVECHSKRHVEIRNEQRNINKSEIDSLIIQE